MELLVGELAQSSLILFVLFPALTVFVSWLRGLLIKEGTTRVVNLGMVINLAMTALILSLGVAGGYPGLQTAAVALNVAVFCEVVYLLWRTRNILAPDIQLLKVHPVNVAGA